MEDDKSSHHRENAREDDRNEELDESPAPDPEAVNAPAEDDPEAD